MGSFMVCTMRFFCLHSQFCGVHGKICSVHGEFFGAHYEVCDVVGQFLESMVIFVVNMASFVGCMIL